MIGLLIACPIMGQAFNNEPSKNDFLIVHREGGSIFFEFEESLLNRDMLFVYHRTAYKHVVWYRNDHTIFLLEPNIKSLSGITIPIDKSAPTETNIIASFPILDKGDDSTMIFINVTGLFETNSVEWYSGFRTDTKTTMPVNEVIYLENEVVLTTKTQLYGGEEMDYFISSNQPTYSFFLLPRPMTPRAFDYRMGFFVEDESSAINHNPKNEKGNISRWRLEKRDEKQPKSEPIEPIIFYLDPAIPDKFKNYVKAGILEWQEAFEKAGFLNAIEIKEVPKGAKNWPLYNVNQSMVRWSNETNVRGSERKSGSSVFKIVDLRSGEILKADILIRSSLQELADDYYIRCSPLDPRAEYYPFPDDLMGNLVQFLVAHEAGHAFGLQDGNYGEYAYPFEKTRNIDWLKTMGFTPSVMNYTRHNYIAQPEDSIPSSLLIQKVGPADHYNIVWGYKVFNDSVSPQKELRYLEDLINEQDSIPWYQFNLGQYEKIGPQYSNEVMDNNNPIKSTQQGLKNMERVIALLPKTTKAENDNAMLKRLYYKTLTLWKEQMMHVSTLVGGYTIPSISMEATTNGYVPIPLDIQIKGMDFLNKNAFLRPVWLSSPEFISRLQYSKFSDRLTELQIELLRESISPLKMKRLENMEQLPEYKGITNAMISKLQAGIWSELRKVRVDIKPERQELQRAYLELLIQHIRNLKNFTIASDSDIYNDQTTYVRNLFTSNLMQLKKEIVLKLTSTDNNIVYFHLHHCLMQIEQIMEH